MIDVLITGAVGDGKTDDTDAIQRAIDRCSAERLDGVIVPPGTYLVGTLQLKDHVLLHISKNAVIDGRAPRNRFHGPTGTSEDKAPNSNGKAVILAYKASGIGIEGRGTIRGSGETIEKGTPEWNDRFSIIHMKYCRDVSIADLMLADAETWCAHLCECDDVRVDGLRIRSTKVENNDGLDIDACRNVIVRGCDIVTNDDAICMKSTTGGEVRNITITACNLSSNCGAIKLGTDTIGNFTNITVTGCTIYDNRMAAIKISSMDGGWISNVIVSNVNMYDVGGLFHMRLGNRSMATADQSYANPSSRPVTENQATGGIENIIFSQINAHVREDTRHHDGVTIDLHYPNRSTSFISGIPGSRIRNITLRDLRASLPGGVHQNQIQKIVPEEEGNYPDDGMFGILPAWGLYARHAEGIFAENVCFSKRNSDARQVVLLDDVISSSTEGIVEIS